MLASKRTDVSLAETNVNIGAFVIPLLQPKCAVVQCCMSLGALSIPVNDDVGETDKLSFDMQRSAFKR